MKKFISMMLILALCLSFAACKKADSKNGTESDSVKSYNTDDSAPQEGEYRADLNELDSLESKINAMPVYAKTEKLESNIKLTIFNNTDTAVSNIKVGFVGLDKEGTLVKAGNGGISVKVGEKQPTDYSQSYTMEESISAGDYKEVSFSLSDESFERITCIVSSYETGGKTVENEYAEAWMKAVFYSDSRREGTKETPESDETIYVINDVDALKAAAAESFDVSIVDQEKYYNYPDALFLTIKNGSDKTITDVEIYAVGIRKDHSRVEIDRSTSEFSIKAVTPIYGSGKVTVKGLSAFSVEEEEGIAAGEQLQSKLGCNFAAFSDYSLIVASYTTADGTKVKNEAAQRWLGAATNGEITRNANDE